MKVSDLIEPSKTETLAFFKKQAGHLLSRHEKKVIANKLKRGYIPKKQGG